MTDKNAEKILDIIASFESTIFLMEVLVTTDRFTDAEKVRGITNLIEAVREDVDEIKKRK